MSIDIIQKKIEYQKHDRYDRKKDRRLKMTIGMNEKKNPFIDDPKCQLRDWMKLSIARWQPVKNWRGLETNG